MLRAPASRVMLPVFRDPRFDMRVFGPFILSCVVVTALAACPSEIDPGGAGCGPDQECADGLACQDGTCVAECSDDGDCDQGVCESGSGLCVDCLDQSDCGSEGLVCNAFTNRCVEPALACTSDADCGGQRCDTIKGACVECISENDCRD